MNASAWNYSNSGCGPSYGSVWGRAEANLALGDECELGKAILGKWRMYV
jgi:hypothetical protein